ncbi:MAG: acetamidase/formamidase family protein [Firmicutes bacterium]|nr:acetamidase/formamidase family protein [Bacillota bacterium]
MKCLTENQAYYSFSVENAPVLTVEQGEAFSLDTQDCYGNQVKSQDDAMDSFDWNHTNPATGPVYVEGVKKDDVICIDIQKIDLRGKSVMVTYKGCDIAQGVDASEVCLMENSNGILDIPTKKGNIQVPIKPMIGVIGVATPEPVGNAVPGDHGGNMDCNLICEGAKLYLKAYADGALVSCGDIHAVMGDGEVVSCGAETPATVTLSAAVVGEKKLPVPFLETEDLYVVIASDPDLDGAAQLAVDRIFYFLTEIAGLDKSDAGRLMSLVGNLRICQIVDPQITCRFEFPKAILTKLGFEGIK